jgi:large subunit ribosomal protein L17
VRRTAEKLITRAKVDSVHNRRQVAKIVQDEAVLAKLFTEIGPRMKDRKGGYTRVLKLGFREGDAAEVAILELVDYKLDTEEKPDPKAKKAAEKPAADKAADKPATEKKPAAAKKPAAEKKPAAAKKPAAEKKASAEKKPAAPKAKAASGSEE